MPPADPTMPASGTLPVPPDPDRLAAFRQVWAAGSRPDLTDFLPADVHQRPDALLRLARLDLELRSQTGEAARVEDYLERFPQLRDSPGAVLALAETEYQQRRPREPRLSIREYLRRFPEQRRELLVRWRRLPPESLTSTVDGPGPTPASAGAASQCPTVTTAGNEDRARSGTANSVECSTLGETPGRPPDEQKRVPGSLPHIPGYSIEQILGRGGMGVVYQARQVALNRPVALKMILAGAHAGPLQLARFQAEARAVARLQHPHIVQIYEIGEQDGQSYFSLEFVDGGSLADRLDDTPQPPRPAAHLVRALAGAMAFAHQQGIVHRDLKPANILMASVPGSAAAEDVSLDRGRWTPKIADFGLAKEFQEDSGQTQSGAIVGTPSYMAPEQAEGRARDVGPTTDVYALGAVLYELLTGRAPFKGANVIETLEQVRTQEPVPPTRLQPKVPRDLEIICLKCLQKDARKRYVGAAELAEDLRRFLDGEPIRARPVGEWSQLAYWYRRNKPLAWASSLAAAALGVGVAVSVVLVVSTTGANRRLEAEVARANGALDESQTVRRQLEASDRRSREFASLSAELYGNQALTLAEQGAVGESLLWLARGLELAPAEEADLQRWLRTNLAGWQQQIHGLTGMLPHRESVRAAAISADGRLAALAEGKAVRIWSVPGGQPVGEPLPHSSQVESLNFTGDAKLLQTTCADGQVRLWDAATGQPAEYSSRGETVVVAGERQRAVSFEKNRAQAWDLKTGKKMWGLEAGTVQGRTANFKTGQFSADGGTFITVATTADATDQAPSAPTTAVFVTAQVGVRGQFNLWEAPGGKPLAQQIVPPNGLHHLTFTADGLSVVTGGSVAPYVSCWNARTGAREADTIKLTNPVERLAAFSPQGTRLITAVPSNTSTPPTKKHNYILGTLIEVWNLQTGKRTWVENVRGVNVPEFVRIEVDALAHSPRTSRFAVAVSYRELDKDGNVKTPTPHKKHCARIYDHHAPGSSRNIVGSEMIHPAPIRALAFSPDGQKIFTGCDDKAVRVWDAGTQKQIGQACYQTGQILSIACSPDAKSFAVGGNDGAVQVWSVESGQPIGQPLRLQGAVGGVAFSPGGQWLLTGSEDRTARLWDAASGNQIGPPLQHTGPVTSVAFRPDPDSSQRKSEPSAKIDFWNAETGARLGASYEPRSPYVAATLSADGRVAALALGTRVVQLVHVESGAAAGKPPALTSEPRSLDFVRSDARFLAITLAGGETQFWDTKADGPAAVLTVRHPFIVSPDGNTIAVKLPQEVQLYDLSAGQPTSKVLAHPGPVWHLLFDAQGRTLATSSQEQVRVWQVDTGKQLGEVIRHAGTIQALAFSPDGRLLLTGSADRTAHLWDAATGQPLGQALGHASAVRTVAFGPDGRTCLTAGDDHTARLWSIVAPRPPSVRAEGAEKLDSLYFSPGGRTACIIQGLQVQLWDADKQQPRGKPLTFPAAVHLAAFSPQGNLLATAYSQDVQIWDPITGQPLGSPRRHTRPVLHQAFSPDGRMLAAADDGVVRLWNTSIAGGETPVLELKTEALSLAFSPDGSRLATGGRDQSARVWNLATGRVERELAGHAGPVQAVAYHPDGKQLASGGSDRTIRLWDPRTGSPAAAPLVVPSAVRRLTFQPGGRVLAAHLEEVDNPRSSQGATVALWDTASGRAVGKPLTHPGGIHAIVWSHDGKLLATAGADRGVRLWDATLGLALGPALHHQGAPVEVMFATDGKALVTGTRDAEFRRWQLPQPRTEGAEWVNGWVQGLTGLRLDRQGVARKLDAAEWRTTRGQ